MPATSCARANGCAISSAPPAARPSSCRRTSLRRSWSARSRPRPGRTRRPCSSTATSTSSRPTRSSSGTRRRSSRRSAATGSTRAASPTTRATSTSCSRPPRRWPPRARLPVNVRVACDGEEETGGHSIVEWVEADERGADACIIFDAGMPEPDVPAFYIGTRGLVYFHVKVRTGERDLHSGVFGGRRAERDARADADAGARDGRAGRAAQRDRRAVRRRAGELGRDDLGPGRRSTSRARRRATAAPPRSSTSGPSPAPRVDVHGLAGGSPLLQKTVIPVEAEANVSIRLAPVQDVEEIAARDGAAHARRRAARARRSRSSAGRWRPPVSSLPTRPP